MSGASLGAQPGDPVALGTDQQILHEGTLWQLNVDGDPTKSDAWVQRRLWLTAAGGLFYTGEKQSAPCGCQVAGAQAAPLRCYLEDHFAFEVRFRGVGPGTAGSATLLAASSGEERDVWLARLASFKDAGSESTLSPLDIYSKAPSASRRRSCSTLDAQAPALEAPAPAEVDDGHGLSDESEEDLPASRMPSLSVPPARCIRRNSQSSYAEKLHTSLLLDWDDTIFPTTWVRRDCKMNWRFPLESQLEPGPRKVLISSLLDKLLDRTIEFFNDAAVHANIFIVTLARRPWVEMSLTNFLPRLKGVIEALNLKVIYAQERVDDGMAQEYSAEEFKSSEEAVAFWTRVKAEAIARELDELHKKNDASWKNIISLGDSDFERYGTITAGEDYMRREMEGGKVLKTGTTADGYMHTAEGISRDGHLKRLRMKTVKMLSEPTVEELTAELALLRSWLPHMVQKDGGFDLEIDCTDDNERLRELHQQVTGERAELTWEELAGMRPAA